MVANASSWIRKIEILKAATDPEAQLRTIASRFNVSSGTVWNTLNEFTSIYQLTEEESDFPRKLLKMYNINLPEEGGSDKLDESDIRNLRHYVERARKREVGDEELDSIPKDFNTVRSGQPGMSYGQPTQTPDKNFDKTTEEGFWRSILYSAKNVNPQATERFINLYQTGKKFYMANPQALLDLMRHMFGPGFGGDAFTLFMNSKGQYVGDMATGSEPSFQQGGMDPMMLMMLMSGGGGGMAQMLPLMMQQGGMGGAGGGQMPQAMQMMMMQELKKQSEKKDQQEQFDKIMNIMMLKMIGGTMDSRTQMDAASGNFMVNEILDKDRNVTKRELVPMATILSNPLMAGGIFGKGGTDETTQAVLRNALEEKKSMMEMYMQQSQPMAQIMTSLLTNFQQKNDPVSMISTLMDIQDKFIKPSGNQVNPEIERMKMDLQLALSQQNMTLEQMKHNWDMEREEKKAGSENVKSWMSMIGQVGEKLAAPAMQIVAGGMGKGGMMNAAAGGQPPGPGGGLPPLGSQPPVKPGGIETPRAPPQQGGMGVSLGVPDPDHNSHLIPDPQPQQRQQGGEMDPQMIMMLSKMEQLEKVNVQYMNEINRLRQLYMSEQQPQQKPQVEPVVSKEELAKFSTEQINEMLENIKDNDQGLERMKHILEAEISDRDWLSSTPPDDEDEPPRKQTKSEDEAPKMEESLEEEHLDELPIDEPEPAVPEEELDSK